MGMLQPGLRLLVKESRKRRKNKHSHASSVPQKQTRGGQCVGKGSGFYNGLAGYEEKNDLLITPSSEFVIPATFNL